MLATTRYVTAIDFLDAAETVLARNEVANGLILGVPGSVRAHPEDEKPENLYLTVHRDGALVGAAVRIPPHNLIVHVEQGIENPDEVLEALLAATLPMRAEIPGLIGRVPEIDLFAREWMERSGYTIRRQVDERIYQLSAVIPPRPVPGRFRQATLADADLVTAWFLAFVRESIPEEESPQVAERSQRALEQGRLFLWEVEEDAGWRPVCMVGMSRALGKGRTVGPVYTSPAERGKGYGINVTAAISQHLLNQGWEYATLFTDLSNPTSNSIYSKIGYEPVCDYAMILLEQRATSTR